MVHAPNEIESSRSPTVFSATNNSKYLGLWAGGDSAGARFSNDLHFQCRCRGDQTRQRTAGGRRAADMLQTEVSPATKASLALRAAWQPLLAAEQPPPSILHAPCPSIFNSTSFLLSNLHSNFAAPARAPAPAQFCCAYSLSSTAPPDHLLEKGNPSIPCRQCTVTGAVNRASAACHKQFAPHDHGKSFPCSPCHECLSIVSERKREERISDMIVHQAHPSVLPANAGTFRCPDLGAALKQTASCITTSLAPVLSRSALDGSQDGFPPSATHAARPFPSTRFDGGYVKRNSPPCCGDPTRQW